MRIRHSNTVIVWVLLTPTQKWVSIACVSATHSYTDMCEHSMLQDMEISLHKCIEKIWLLLNEVY